jgi:hypothetical protein
MSSPDKFDFPVLVSVVLSIAESILLNNSTLLWKSFLESPCERILITPPSKGSPVAPGVSMSPNPVVRSILDKTAFNRNSVSTAFWYVSKSTPSGIPNMVFVANLKFRLAVFEIFIFTS